MLAYNGTTSCWLFQFWYNTYIQVLIIFVCDKTNMFTLLSNNIIFNGARQWLSISPLHPWAPVPVQEHRSWRATCQKAQARYSHPRGDCKNPEADFGWQQACHWMPIRDRLSALTQEHIPPIVFDYNNFVLAHHHFKDQALHQQQLRLDPGWREWRCDVSGEPITQSIFLHAGNVPGLNDLVPSCSLGWVASHWNFVDIYLS